MPFSENHPQLSPPQGLQSLNTTHIFCIPAAGMYRRAARLYRLAGGMEGLAGGIIYEKHHRLDYMPHTPYLVPSYPTKALRMALARLEGERPHMILDIMTPPETPCYNGKIRRLWNSIK